MTVNLNTVFRILNTTNDASLLTVLNKLKKENEDKFTFLKAMYSDLFCSIRCNHSTKFEVNSEGNHLECPYYVGSAAVKNIMEDLLVRMSDCREDAKTLNGENY